MDPDQFLGFDVELFQLASQNASPSLQFSVRQCFIFKLHCNLIRILPEVTFQDFNDAACRLDLGNVTLSLTTIG